MKTTLVTLTTALTAASPALAHSGMHLHPHGIDTAALMLFGSGVVAIAGAALVAIRVRK
ncbi:hypothetical protein [Actibacterium sp.]|uniref:hypothetical protein n=1 Tax=Actibacterium sp. TaxID=1872125 RepID=UPI003562A8DC